MKGSEWLCYVYNNYICHMYKNPKLKMTCLIQPFGTFFYNICRKQKRETRWGVNWEENTGAR